MELRHVEDLAEILDTAANKGPIELEIGCGDGHFISSLAEKNADRFFIGIEQKRKRCAKILKKIEATHLGNVAVICGRAEDLLPSVPPASFDGIHLYFPDPWPKTKHRKRRLLRKPALDLISQSIKPGGRFLIATDFFEYFVQIKFLILLGETFTIVDDDPLGEVFSSVFASKFTQSNRPIYYISAVRNRGGTAPA